MCVHTRYGTKFTATVLGYLGTGTAVYGRVHIDSDLYVRGGRGNSILIGASKVTTPPYYNTSARPWALKLGGRLLLHPWAVPVASYRALGPSGARK